MQTLDVQLHACEYVCLSVPFIHTYKYVCLYVPFIHTYKYVSLSVPFIRLSVCILHSYI